MLRKMQQCANKQRVHAKDHLTCSAALLVQLNQGTQPHGFQV